MGDLFDGGALDVDRKLVDARLKVVQANFQLTEIDPYLSQI